MNAEEPPNLDMIAYRVKKLEEGMTAFSDRVDKQYEKLYAAIERQGNVPMTLYLSEREAMAKDIDASRKLAMATFGMLASALIGAIIIAISTVL